MAAAKRHCCGTITGQLASLEGRVALGHNVLVGYYAQTHEGLNAQSTVLDEIRQATPFSEESARTFSGAFFSAAMMCISRSAR